MTAVAERPKLMGRAEPRLFSPPLRELTPDTSGGYQAIQFAEEVVGAELLPWQKEWLVRALELREDGSFRYRTIVTTVARQNGKSFLLKILALYFLYLGGARLVLGAAQSLDISREAWVGAVELAQESEDLAVEIDNVRYANGEQCLTLVNGARYRITATTRGAGRGLSVDLLILDEIREYRDFSAWSALSKTTNARPNALTVALSNAGDDQSVVLNSLRSSALAGTDDTLGILEWSAPDGCELDDPQAWAQANPALGHTMSEQAIRSAMTTDPPSTFRTECLNQRVDALDAAVDPASWEACADRHGDLSELRDRLVACLDVAPDGQHVTLVGAAPLDGEDGLVRAEVLGAWTSTDQARRALPGLLGALRPRALAWFPSGPGAVLGVDLADEHGVTVGQWTVKKDAMRAYAPGVVELTGQAAAAACQSLADLVQARAVLHPDDPLLNAHVAASQRLRTGDGWRFVRRGAGHVDAAYALAGAVHLARSLPLPAPPPRSQVF